MTVQLKCWLAEQDPCHPAEREQYTQPRPAHVLDESRLRSRPPTPERERPRGTAPNQRYSLHDIETARRARRRQLRKDINDRIPTTPRPPDDPPAPARRPTKRLKTYEEDE